MEKNYRIHTNITADTLVNVNMQQDFDFLEILSLKLRQKDAYRLHSSNYGVVVGRVLANDAFGIPNAKVSVFIERDSSDSNEMRYIYPYSEVMSRDSKSRRYNLLPDYSDDVCYRVVGTFPRKRYLLDDNMQLEVYEKYWKFTTVTNSAGDYMIFGVPTGNTQVHADLDLSDIGVLSQKPRDFMYKGYTETMFDNPNQFKQSTTLSSLAQIFTQDKSVYVHPFWGDSENSTACITRCDIQIEYKFEPTCIFMGSLVSDNGNNAIGHKCAPHVDNGMNDQLIAGSGTIEMIRKTTDGLVEEFQIKGNQLIDSDGVWCYQIPMNLDYIGTDEYGNIVPTDNPSKGIPTRAQVRFRISKTDSGDEGFSRHTAKYLVPMNPIFSEKSEHVVPTIPISGREVEKMYKFGSATPQYCFRDLYWDNVYSVKNYIPKVQVAHRAYAPNYGALKGANHAGDKNEVPFNKMRVNLPFTYSIICIILSIIVNIIYLINKILCLINRIVIKPLKKILDIKIPIINKRIGSIIGFGFIDYIGCISFGSGESIDNGIMYVPGCGCSEGKDATNPPPGSGPVRKEDDKEDLIDDIQRDLGEEYKVIRLDFYQDWLNGCLYFPLWHWRKRKKKKFLFFTIAKAKNEFCDCDVNKWYKRLKSPITCSVTYKNNKLETDTNLTPPHPAYWHKDRKSMVKFGKGLIKRVENKDGLDVYYYAAVQATENNEQGQETQMVDRKANFKAIRLYATDIILIGSLRENNQYGIPQFYKCLPSTTSNIPPIATVQEADDATIAEEEKEGVKENSIGTENAADSGVTITTGMDWGHEGNEQTPAYKTGLFMDLACTYAKTAPKSCINVERLSELGVSLDTQFNMPFRKDCGETGTIEYGEFDADGFISKIELEDMENRAMFATMNHIGFIPQDYQESVSAVTTTQVTDTMTNYLIPKFKYTYPVDFDGRLKTQMDAYRGSFTQSMQDIYNDSYTTFRLGAEQNTDPNLNPDGRIRHFYIQNNSGLHEMPLYNNSFYFYFGLNPGNTAIDKFRKQYDSECVKPNKSPFTVDVDSRGRTYCDEAYSDAKKLVNAYGYIKISSDDIRTPWSYNLYDAYGRLVASKTSIKEETEYIGGSLVDGQFRSNTNGCVEAGSDESQCEYLRNTTYTLEIIDADGKSVVQKVTLERQKITGEYLVYGLGTKFYDTGTTRIDYICNDDTQFYGMIKMTGFSIDGYECDIVDANFMSYDKGSRGEGCYKFCIKGSCAEISQDQEVYAFLEMYSLDSDPDGEMRNCLCDDNKEINFVRRDTTDAKLSIETNKNEKYFYDVTDGVLTINIYQPNKYLLVLKQGCPNCDAPSEDNITSDTIDVENGTPFKTMLNNMPTLFMLGTSNDNKEATESMKSNFYHRKWSDIAEATDGHLSGWLSTHQETAYKFKHTCKDYEVLWDEFVKNVAPNIYSEDARRNILMYKFDTMFSLSDAVYVTNESLCEFRFRGTGGSGKRLSRNVVPDYGNGKLDTYLFADRDTATIEPMQCNIVGWNYSGIATSTDTSFEKSKPEFNKTLFSKYELNGNYFACFTKDGGFINQSKIDKEIFVERSPSFASVSPRTDNRLKPKGTTEKGDLEADFEYAYDRGTQTITGDKERNVLPYMRAMFVDRRLDFNLTIFAPSLWSEMSLYIKGNDKWKDSVWKGGRVFGTIYNGIEMSYDAERNIISATTQDLVEGQINVTKNKALEYSYNIPIGDQGTCQGNDVTTKYNTNTDINYRWESDITGGDWKEETNTLIKRFYTSEILYRDIRDYIWSEFNLKRLETHVTGNTNEFNGNTNEYIFQYPKGHTGKDLFNGDLKVVDGTIADGVYPTRRYVDIGKLPQSTHFNMNITSCSYDMVTHKEYKEYKGNEGEEYGTDIIKATTSEGERTEVELDFSKPITVIGQMNGSSGGNLRYAVYSKDDGQITFKAVSWNIAFTLNEFDAGDFYVYSAPKIMKVLPYKNNIDGIGFIKTTKAEQNINEFDGNYGGATKTSDALIDNDLIRENFSLGYVNSWFNFNNVKVIVPDGVSKDNNTFPYLKKGDLRLETGDPDALKVVYMSKKDLGDDAVKVKAFAILIERHLENAKGDNLTRRIRTIETSEVFDARDITLCNDHNPKPDDRDWSSYVICNGAEESSNGGGDGNQGGGTGTTATGMLVQYVTFVMTFNNEQDVSKRNCEALAQYDLIGYKMRFTDTYGSYYDIDACETAVVSGTGSTVPTALFLKFEWTTEMGVLSDTRWKERGFTCSLIARTRSGFVYQTDPFTMKVISSTDRSQMTQEGEKYPTTIQFT